MLVRPLEVKIIIIIVIITIMVVHKAERASQTRAPGDYCLPLCAWCWFSSVRSGPQASCQPHSASLGNRFVGGRIRPHALESQECPSRPQTWAGHFCQGKCSPHFSICSVRKWASLESIPSFCRPQTKRKQLQKHTQTSGLGRMAACMGELGAPFSDLLHT